MSTDESAKFNDALATYYKLKRQYELSIEKEIMKLIKNTNLSVEEKHEKFKLFKNRN